MFSFIFTLFIFSYLLIMKSINDFLFFGPFKDNNNNKM